MDDSLSIACLQLNSDQDVSKNIELIKKLSQQAVAAHGVKAIALPENAFCHPYHSRYQPELDKVLPELTKLARELQLWIFAGTLPQASMQTPGKVYSALNVINDRGERVCTYKKIHLFDVRVQEEGVDYQESKYFEAGDEIVVVKTPWGNIGLAICYDLRFPELFHAMECYEPLAFIVPSAFTLHTGKKHWAHLLSARAVDNFAWIVAPNQSGMHPGDRSTFGHTSIVNPDGEVVAQLAEGVGYIYYRISKQSVNDLRKHIPLAQHRKISANTRKKFQ